MPISEIKRLLKSTDKLDQGTFVIRDKNDAIRLAEIEQNLQQARNMIEKMMRR